MRASPLNPVAPRRRPVRLQPVLHQPGELLQRATSLLNLKCSPSSCACPAGLRFSLFPVVFQGSPSLLGKGLPCLTPCRQLLPGSSPPSALVPLVTTLVCLIAFVGCPPALPSACSLGFNRACFDIERELLHSLSWSPLTGCPVHLQPVHCFSSASPVP